MKIKQHELHLMSHPDIWANAAQQQQQNTNPHNDGFPWLIMELHVSIVQIHGHL